MTKHLFLFAIAPVQSFIEQARKTQDLYAGSFLLSHLCRTAGRKMKTDYRGDIIFPDIENKSIPNRFVAIVDAKGDKLKEIGDDLQQAVEEEFKRIANSIITKLETSKANGFDEQISSYFTINWLFLPFNEKDYKRCYSEIESFMGAMKTVRAFQQLPDSEKGRKCSICGERNVKFYRMTEKEKKDADVKNRKLFSSNVHVVGNKNYEPITLRYLRAGEGTCAVCFTKRLLDKASVNDYEASFPSTANIALFEAFNQLKEKRSDLIRLINSDDYEPQDIFAIKKNSTIEDDTKKDATQKLYDALKENNIDYSSYYAVMLFDGDSMGEWLSGDRIKEGRLKEFHEALTGKLGDFANKVRNNIKEPKGVTVYAGGEDFLGFFNLNHLLEDIKTLRNEFDALVNMPLKEKGFFQNESSNMTFSAGVVIAHIKTPLSEVLHWARKMEHEAKEMDDNKDAFAIAVLKHSGEIEKTVFKWRLDDRYITETVSQIVSEINKDRLSNTFIKRLNQEMLRLMGKDSQFAENQMIETEMKRLSIRSCIKAKDESKEDFEKRKERIAEELRLSEILMKSKSMNNFLSFLNIADFIARQVKGGANEN